MHRHLSTLYILASFIVLPFMISGCDNDPDERDDDKITVSILKFGDCDSTYQDMSHERWHYKLNDDKLIVSYDPILVNCANKSMNIQLDVQPKEINILEKELGEPIANCLCAKPFKYVVDELPDGVYTVNIYRHVLSKAGLIHSFQIKVD